MTIRKIMLICGSLESGRDGVGDYCRRLAEEFAKLGIETLVVAANDRAIAEEPADDASHPSIKLVRLPERLPLGRKSARLSSLIAEWRPDWVSLQFVSYGFNRKGFATRELRWLPRLFREQKLHVMLHELWVGLGLDASLKNTVYGPIQKLLVLALLRRLRPRVTHTSIPYYQRVLANHGVEAEVLPIFGNIAVTSDTAEPWLGDAIRSHGGPDLSRDGRPHWLFGLFGGLSPLWPTEALLARLAAVAQNAGRRVVVVSAGHAGPHAASLLERWRREFPAINFVAIGPRPPAEISQFINSMDFGLTSSTYYALGKSGSAAVMLEHGLPVIVSWGDIAPDLPAVDATFKPLIWKNDSQLEGRLMQPIERHRRPDWSAFVARSLIERLMQADR